MAIRTSLQGTGEFDGSRQVVGQHDRTLLSGRPIDEFQCEFSARTASKARTEPIGDLLRQRHRAFSPCLGRQFGGCFDELLVGDAIAQTDVHSETTSVESEAGL